MVGIIIVDTAASIAPQVHLRRPWGDSTVVLLQRVNALELADLLLLLLFVDHHTKILT